MKGGRGKEGNKASEEEDGRRKEGRKEEVNQSNEGSRRDKRRLRIIQDTLSTLEATF